MTKTLDRREAMLAAGGLAAAVSTAAAAKPATRQAGPFRPMPLPAATMFPHTHYFEMDSAKAGARYGIWITLPRSYDKDPARRFPAVFMPDGNESAPMAAGLADLGAWDFIDHYQSTIQIAVGYTGDDIERALAVRARDLLPPKEPLPPGLADNPNGDISGGLLDRTGNALYLHNLQNPAADRFLAFLSEELYPFVAATYRVEGDALGLWGHSYGGLFATYAALQPRTIFKNFGASSPGILLERSMVFKLYADAAAAGGLSPRNFHMTCGTREITGPNFYQYMVGGGATEFMRLAGTTPLKGLNFSSGLIPDESHMTMGAPAVAQFMRTFYLRSA